MEALQNLAFVMGGVPEGAAEISAEALATVERVWHEVNEHLNVHFVKEEEVFFPFIERLIPGARVKFQFLHVDHERLREAFESYTHALQNYRALGHSVEGVQVLRTVAAEMIRWFSYHIVAEDSIYFEIAGSQLSPDESADVLCEMARIEARLRECEIEVRKPVGE